MFSLAAKDILYREIFFFGHENLLYREQDILWPQTIFYTAMIITMKKTDGTKKIIIFAKRNLYAGEEITYDYCFNYEDGDALSCTCGAPNCIGRYN